MNTKTDAKAKADRSKGYVAAEDTIIEGRPVRKGADVKTSGMSDEAFQGYVDADLIIEAAIDPKDERAAKALKDAAKVLQDAAKEIDKSQDMRTEK